MYQYAPPVFNNPDKQKHRSHDLLMTFVTDVPRTAAAIAIEADIAGITVTQASRILTSATNQGKILSRRDPDQQATRHRQVYWRKPVTE